MRTAYGSLLLSLPVLGFIFLAVLFPWFNFLFANAKGEWQLVLEEEIVHAGDLILDGNQTFLIENCTFTVKGIVTIRDNAKLIVRDA